MADEMLPDKPGSSRMLSRWAPVVLYMALIYAVSALSIRMSLFQKTQKIHVDWFMHIVEYSVLGFLLARAIHRPRLFWLAILVATLYGVSDEIHQSSVPARDASPYDACADMVGAALGTGFWNRRQKQVNA